MISSEVINAMIDLVYIKIVVPGGFEPSSPAIFTVLGSKGQKD